MYNEG